MNGAAGRRAGLALCLGAAVALSACASGRVALLSGENGAPTGGVALFDPRSEAERGQLTQPNTEAALGAGPVRARPLSTNYDALLSAMPAPPQVFTLYFIEGTTQIAPESAATLEALRKAIGPASDVQITGHTDTTGDAASNDKLSLDRAVEVRSALAQAGLPVADARVTGRGERDLKVQTGDGVSEPANRRVEVIVR
ncbi:MAG: OmpA family protein [Proteobacteria bacterium]|nr:OmpA family protein [Pseudomonadota bacterium]